ncbi:lipoprotein insertase outer membrane protein LolB [Candidatus Enterovibrio altilux]|uniref:Outer-membrane lipoprotein LolB n=1 Tax=Candidatus Enterovibrio altilux TaxID=1927128 RepID=A0A291BBT1_9GAMM|nr:lipoprotein insertase outer membrane protein LolB [Candidatus Enterovibrio luxaltus]ATF10478.1 Outer membrane lipoprotein LolB precursor [Candidatus Enterovibrio luxaltus]
MVQNIDRFFLAVIILILMGCSNKLAPQMEWQIHKQTLLNITQFTAKGKIIFIGPEQRISANFIWEQNHNAILLQLINFFGVTLLRLEATPNYAILIDNEGQRYVGKNAASLLRQLTGMTLPINEMTQWIKGLPTGNNNFRLSADNRVVFLSTDDSSTNQLSLQLEYPTYDSNICSLLPTKIKININNNHQKVNLIISNWKY